MGTGYKTKQKDRIKEYMLSLESNHTTVSQIADYFHDKGTPIGVTTIYRHLESLVQTGMVKKYMLDNSASACYQYIAGEECSKHYHFKCKTCNKVFHMECHALDDMQAHLLKNHHFQADIQELVIVGTCAACMESAN